MAETIQRRSEERVDVGHLTHMRLGQDGAAHPVRVRNLSQQGMMGEGSVALRSGTRLTVDLPEQGEVSGVVVWVQEPRFGVAFDRSGDPAFA